MIHFSKKGLGAVFIFAVVDIFVLLPKRFICLMSCLAEEEKSESLKMTVTAYGIAEVNSFLVFWTGVRVTLTSVLETHVATEPSVRTHMAPITVTVARSSKESTVKMPPLTSMCPRLGT